MRCGQDGDGRRSGASFCARRLPVNAEHVAGLATLLRLGSRSILGRSTASGLEVHTHIRECSSESPQHPRYQRSWGVAKGH